MRGELAWGWLTHYAVGMAFSGVLLSLQGAAWVHSPTLLPALAVGARRLHDIGRSGWWQLLSLSGIGTLVLIYWWVQPSGE